MDLNYLRHIEDRHLVLILVISKPLWQAELLLGSLHIPARNKQLFIQLTLKASVIVDHWQGIQNGNLYQQE